MSESDPNYPDEESEKRFEAALKGALNTPHKPLKEKQPKEKVSKEPSVR